MTSYKTNEFKTDSKKHNNSNRMASLMDNPFKQFSASKMSTAVKPMTVVEYKDILGILHRIPVRNRPEMKRVQALLSLLKEESKDIKQIISEYPIKMGKVDKKFLPELKKELKDRFNIKSTLVEKLAGY